MKRGKKFLAAIKKYDKAQEYEVPKACALLKELHYAKFDETVEVSVRLNLKKSQTVRDTVVLPNQFKGEKKVLVFCKGDKEKEALEAGATFVGSDELIQKIKDGWLDFDIAVATPDMMKDVGKLGMILGRRGLMPNPKTGTVTFDVKGAINELKKGRVEYRVDKTGVVHLAVGKVSMESDKIAENVKTFLDDVVRKKPSDAKGDFLGSVYLCSTMGPGIKISMTDKE
jgi:large subunit ribosomal protein L1